MSSFQISVLVNTICVLLIQTVSVKAQSAPAKTDTTLSNKPFVAWAKQHAVALQETEKAIGYNDLQPLKKMIGKARVVALGESSHGMPEPIAFRNRLFKFLVEQCGFTTIVLEADMAGGVVGGTYVATGEGSAEAGANKLSAWGGSPENIELLKWMREYNANPKHKNKLSFYGMDIELIGYAGDTTSRHYAIDHTLTYLRKVDPESAGDITQSLMPFFSRLSFAKYPALSKPEHDQLTAILDGIIALIERQRINYIAKSSKDEYEFAHRIALAALGTDRLARITPDHIEREIPPEAWKLVAMRDATMADNVRWILNYKPNTKVLVFSHNAHVKNAAGKGGVWDAFAQPPNMLGQYLRSTLANDYFIIGTSCAPTIKTAQPGSIDLALTDVGKPRFIVDLKAAAFADYKIKNWLNVTRPMEANGYSFITLPIGTAFNALLFLEKSAPKK
jgi:erythromycin esterase